MKDLIEQKLEMFEERLSKGDWGRPIHIDSLKSFLHTALLEVQEEANKLHKIDLLTVQQISQKEGFNSALAMVEEWANERIKPEDSFLVTKEIDEREYFGQRVHNSALSDLKTFIEQLRSK